MEWLIEGETKSLGLVKRPSCKGSVKEKCFKSLIIKLINIFLKVIV